jgi:hypothetical protein
VCLVVERDCDAVGRSQGEAAYHFLRALDSAGRVTQLHDDISRIRELRFQLALGDSIIVITALALDKTPDPDEGLPTVFSGGDASDTPNKHTEQFYHAAHF